jgi:hypothetical protein
MIAIRGSGSPLGSQGVEEGTALAGIGIRTWRALQVGTSIWTVTSGVVVGAYQTDGTDVEDGPRQPV